MFGQPPFVNYTFTWDIDWSIFRGLSAEKKIEKIFSTAYLNVVYVWSIEIGIYPETETDKFGLYLFYKRGPFTTLYNVFYEVQFFNSRQPHSRSRVWQSSGRDFDREGDKSGWDNLELKDTFREQYQPSNICSLICQVNLRIPMSGFLFSLDIPAPTSVPPDWSIELFKFIDNPESPVFPNAKIVSRTGRIFYCHKDVLAVQSDALAAMLRHPVGDDTYPFPEMGDDSMRAFFEFLYTGRFELLTALSTTDILETADLAEQYGLEKLKKASRAVLWIRAVENPVHCFDIARFSILHYDYYKYVMDRAFNVLADNIHFLRLGDNFHMSPKFGDSRELVDAFNLYTATRVCGHFSID